MKVALLTQPVPHKKIFDVLCLPKTKGYEEVDVLASLMTYAKKSRPAVAYRPGMGRSAPSTEGACWAFGYGYREISSYDEADGADIRLVCGAGIIPPGVRGRAPHRVVSFGLHSLRTRSRRPQVGRPRRRPVGVTTRFLGDRIDAGEIVERRELELRAKESFFELGMRIYSTEVSMLVNALEKLDEPHEYVPSGNTVKNRRMLRELERKMQRRYEAALLDLEEQHAVQRS